MRTAIASAACIFALALGVRLLYQSAAVTDGPVRADAAKYYSAAWNLRAWGVYSTDRPGPRAPASRTDLSPGYPLLLAALMEPAQSLPEFLTRARRVQALLGASTAVLAFLLAFPALGTAYAAVAGALTALSPHLIAMDDYLLTESSFTFALAVAAAALSAAWRRSSIGWALFAGLAFGAAAQTRAIAYGLPLAAAALLLLPVGSDAPPLGRRFSLAGAALLGFLCVLGAHRGFVSIAVVDDAAVREEPARYVRLFSAPGAYLEGALRPPNFAVEGKSHVLPDHGDERWKLVTESSFADEPLAYLRWNLGGKLLTLSSFDQAYNGDVYVYPMKRRGFEENAVLRTVHGTLWALHWPLFALALAGLGTIVFVAFARAGARATRTSTSWRPLLVPALVFAYFYGVLLIIRWWLPRYTIPTRPFGYVLAAAVLAWAIPRVRERLPRLRR